MKLIRLLIVAAGGFYLYKRFFADSDAGSLETQAAEPFSSDQLSDNGAEAQPEPAATPAGAGNGERPDPLTRPSWLQPGDEA